MIIDKSKLHPLLWAVVGAWKAGDQDLHLHTDALDQFLGEHTVEQVALQLLAELSLAGEARDAYAADKKSLAFALNDARAEAEALRKDAERYRWLRDECGVVAYKEIVGSIGPGMLPSGEMLEEAIDAAKEREACHV